MQSQMTTMKLGMSERLKTFRDEAYSRGLGGTSSSKEANWTEAFFELYPHMPVAQRQAHSFAYALLNEPIHIHDHSLIAGQIYQACAGAESPDRSETCGQIVNPFPMLRFLEGGVVR